MNLVILHIHVEHAVQRGGGGRKGGGLNPTKDSCDSNSITCSYHHELHVFSRVTNSIAMQQKQN